MSSKLVMIDPEEYVLEGEFERLRAADGTFLDEANILAAIEQYKTDYVDQGLALGEFNEGFLVMPTIVEYGGEMVEAEQVVEEEKDPAFMIIDIYWDRDKRAICGKIILLDTEDGDKIKKAIGQGIEPFMSAAQTDLYTVMDKETGRVYTRISNIQGYKISLFNFHSTM